MPKVLCTYKERTDAVLAVAWVEGSLKEIPEYEFLTATPILIVTASQKFVDKLAEQPGIESVEPNDEKVALIEPVEEN